MYGAACEPGRVWRGKNTYPAQYRQSPTILAQIMILRLPLCSQNKKYFPGKTVGFLNRGRVD
jgi:hypothetical protein